VFPYRDRVPPYSVTFSYVLDSFDAVHDHSPAAAAHHRQPVRWFLECCQRRGDPAFTYTGQGDRWSLTFSGVDAADEAEAVDAVTVLARQIWPNRTPVTVDIRT
jgi:hypothetical protein